TSSAWEITPPISPRRSITWSRVAPSPISVRRAIPPRSRRWWRDNNQEARVRMNPRILIVEDEEALTLLLRYNLEAAGYEVETVARGDEADVRLREGNPDLVILDWMLPGLSGIELCRRLRARPDTRQLPIIMLTARGEESE